MGLFDWLKDQFIDVIEWLDDTHDTIIYRFDRHDNEIKYGAKLIVRPSQVAVFVNEGEIADILGPGTYELETKNLPILTDLQHWDHGFQSPFKAEVYFVSTKRFSDLKWGTKHPIIIKDPQLGPVRVRAFGTYEIRVKDPAKVIEEVAGTDGLFTVDEIDDRLSDLIVSKLPEVLAKSGISILELAKHYRELGERIREQLAPYFEEYGFSLEKLLIESVSLPKEVEQALDERSAMEIVGDKGEYLRYKTAKGIEKGGAASELVGLGAGMAAANQVFKATPPPIPDREEFYIARDKTPVGPLTKEQLLELVQNGELGRDDLVWREGMEEWKRAEEVLPDLFKKVPPPLP
ncbi:MAG: SPFH domain-containing protein [Epsilonproteobacteria bacterium]|nr:antifreeze protein [Campylobacterota bacterium]NPA57072.1 SPFH domain-containing protein [Campylobacterota bacterium]